MNMLQLLARASQVHSSVSRHSVVFSMQCWFQLCSTSELLVQIAALTPKNECPFQDQVTGNQRDVKNKQLTVQNQSGCVDLHFESKRVSMN